MGYMLKALVQLWPLLKEVFIKDNSKDAHSKKLVLMIMTVASTLLFVTDSRSMEAWFGKMSEPPKPLQKLSCPNEQLIGYLEAHIQDLIKNNTSLSVDRDALKDQLNEVTSQMSELERRYQWLKRHQATPDTATTPTSPSPGNDPWREYQELYNEP